MKIEIALYLLVLALVLVLTTCTHTQETMTGAAAGGIASAVVAGPIGAAGGAGAI